MDSRSWSWTGRPGVLWFMGSQRVGHNWATELNLYNPAIILYYLWDYLISLSLQLDHQKTLNTFIQNTSHTDKDTEWCHLQVNASMFNGVQLFCDPNCSLPGSSVHGIFQARMLEWVAISFSRRTSWARDQTQGSCIGRQILYHWATWEALCQHGWT